MRIGYDAKRIFRNFTGLGNYGRTLLRDVQHRFPAHAYHLFTPPFHANSRTEYFQDPDRFRVHLPPAFSPLWRSMGVRRSLRQLEIDVFHGLSHEIPIGISNTGIPSVVTIHDLIFHRYPNQYKWLDRQIYAFKFRYACQHADKVIAISEQTRRDIVDIYGIDPAKIEIVYQACDPSFQRALTAEQQRETLAPYALPEQYLLYVGSIIERKGLLQIVKALKILSPELDIPLVAVGAGREYKQEVEKYIHEEGLDLRVLFRPDIPFSAFPALYQRSAVFVYPSLYEGFGIPLIEALWSKTPVITSNRSSLPEAGGPDSWYVDPESPEAIADAITTVLDGGTEAQARTQAGYAYVQRFANEKLASEMMAVYQKLV